MVSPASEVAPFGAGRLGCPGPNHVAAQASGSASVDISKSLSTKLLAVICGESAGMSGWNANRSRSS